MKAIPLCAILAAAPFFFALGEAPRVLPAASLPDDIRLHTLKDLEGYFPWSPPASKVEWDTRAASLRVQMRVALGLWPEPSRNPLNTTIHGRIEREGYTVEKVSFESMPGLWHTGNLYRPKGLPGKLPAVIVTHGHWQDARFWEKTDAALDKEIESGHERSRIGGRTIFQSIGVHLARMGCVAFVCDMLGNADSQQISAGVAHGFKVQRPELISPKPGEWGLFSPQAETHSQNVMGIQTWNNIRSLDFLESLEDVDPTRLAITGASGGGTQAMLLAALDPRVAVSMPCVMVSTAMQGGCTCENASLLRIGTGNVEFAALFAPKPMSLTTAKDWTVNLSKNGYPDLLQHWKNLGAPEHLALFDHPDFPHNFNQVTREHLYGFLNAHFRLGLPGERLKERDYEPLTREQLSVWNHEHPAPSGGAPMEKTLLRWWAEDSDRTIAQNFEATAIPALHAIFARTLEGEKAAMDRSTFTKEDRGDWWLLRGTVKNEAHREQVPCLFFHPKNWNGRTVIWLNEKGKTASLSGDGPTAGIAGLLAAGMSVIAPDLFMQGEFLSDGASDTPVRKVKNPREAAAYTFGYNHSLVVRRTHDVLTLLAFIRDHEMKSSSVAIVAPDRTSVIAAAARALAVGRVERLVLRQPLMRFLDVGSIYSPWFQPGAARFGDMDGLLRLGKGAVTRLSPEDWDQSFVSALLSD